MYFIQNLLIDLSVDSYGVTKIRKIFKYKRSFQSFFPLLKEHENSINARSTFPLLLTHALYFHQFFSITKLTQLSSNVHYTTPSHF